MSNRNFDSHTIITRLQNKVIANNMYGNQLHGQRIIQNPQNSVSSAGIISHYNEGVQTTYSRSLENTCGECNISIGGIYEWVVPPIVPPAEPLLPPAPVIEIILSNRLPRQRLIVFSQQPATPSITNYSYSIDNGISYTLRSPAATTTPLLIIFPSLGTFQVSIKAINSNGESLPSNTVSVNI
jgi:hypothetical protein